MQGFGYATVLYCVIETIIFCFCFSVKVRIVKLVSVNEDFVSAMTLLGEEDEPSVVVKETLERLVCSLYLVKIEIDVNWARYKFFTKKKKPPPLQSLPPTRDALYLHIECANYNASCAKKR